MPTITSAQLTDLTAQHNAIRDRHEQRVFYAETLFPALRDSFAAQPADAPPIEVLLLPVSNPHTPVLSVARWKPQVALLIYSTESVRHHTAIAQQIAALDPNMACIKETVLNIEIEPERLYATIKQLTHPYLRGEQHNAHIALDITGGTKVMSVGAAMAVSLLGGRLVYLLSATAKDDIQQRQVGTEQPRLLADPYAVFGDLEAAEAQRLFAAHDYGGAQRRFYELAARVPGADGARFAALAALAAMYAAWDVLDFARAQVRATALLVQPFDQVTALAPHRARLQQQWDLLHTLVAVSGSVVGRDAAALTTLADPAALLALLGTLHANALRRAAQGRYDFAALFRYRCLALISQHRLATHGLLSTAPNYKTLPFPKADLSARFQTVQRALGRKQPRGLPDRIMLFDGYMLLAALDDPLVRDFPIRQIEERRQARNTSVLAHGYRLIEETAYNHFAAVVDQIVDRLFTHVLQQSRANWEHAAQFVVL